MIGLTMLLFRRIWILGLWVWKAVECFKWGLMGYLGRKMEDFVAKGVLTCAVLAQDVSVGNLRMWPRDCFCAVC